MRQLKPVASKAVIGPMPFWPLLMASQTGSVPIPTEVSNPTPVTTTLRCKQDSRDSWRGTAQRRAYFFFDSM